MVVYNACSVSSGVLVCTQPSRFEMRCTWISTQMFLSLLKARIITRLAVFRPTPGSVIISSSVRGTRPLNLLTIIFAASFTNTALLR